MQEIESTLQGFLKDKQLKKENTIEAALCPIINSLISEYDMEIPASQIWAEIIGNSGIDAYYDEKRPDKIQTDFGTIYRNTITGIICDKFGAKKRHTEKGSVLTFDVEKLKKITKSYESETKIQVKLIEHNPDGYDGSDDFGKALTTSEENHNIEITNKQSDITDISEENLDSDVNNTMGKNENATDVPAKLSDPSEPSANLDKNADKKDGHIVNDMIKSDPNCSIKASPPSTEFQCYYCKQFLPSQNELIAHMDIESTEARQRTEKV